MTVYARQIASAKRLIEKKGAKVTWRKPADASQDADKPWNAEPNPPQDFPVSIAFFDDGGRAFASLMKGTDLPTGYELGYMPAVTFEPGVGDDVIRNGEALRVAYVKPLQPDGTPILYVVGFEN